MSKKQKTHEDVRGFRIKCVNYVECPVCYGCKNYNVNDSECLMCSENKKINICDSKLHINSLLSKLIKHSCCNLDEYSKNNEKITFESYNKD